MKDRQSNDLPPTWFESRITLEQIRACFSKGEKEIRIASGFFTIKGWGLIRQYTQGKKVHLLVGIDEPGEERARMALVKEIMRHLATGLDVGRRQSVEDLVARMESNALSIVDARASSHHGKLYIVDRHTAIIASANTTGRGFVEQIESGTVHTLSEVDCFVRRFSSQPGVSTSPETQLAMSRSIELRIANCIDKFDEYFANAADITQELLETLRRWLRLVRPWDIYLKTLLALEQIKPIKTSYNKTPVSYQQDMIAQALRQICTHGGSMLVASTGLGKTVMGTYITIQLRAKNVIDKAIVICPVPVRKSWQKEMRSASIHADYFNLNVLDREDLTQARTLENWDLIVEEIREGRGRYLLIFDESHQLRKRYPDEYSNRKQSEARRERRAFSRINQLVNQLENGMVKVLLLTGSPYATDIDNINTQLHILPHTRKSSAVLFPEYFDGAYAWTIEEPEEFTKLPVANQLTTPHVAKYYGQTDECGRYLQFGKERRYFPDVHLFKISFSLPFEDELGAAIDRGYFHLDTPNSYFRKNIETQVKTAWSSSPQALQDILERVVDTPGGLKELDFAKQGKSTFKVERSQRQAMLKPILKQLEKLTPDRDEKFQALLQILRFHCPQEKVIIFCERLPTANYLEQALLDLLPWLRVFSTVVQKETGYEHKQPTEIEKAIDMFAPISNKVRSKAQLTYNVFISTDAFGIGVNMQDASVVVNYDISWTPIEPTQRAGRILRPWHEFRTIQLYTLVPTVKKRTKLKYQLLNISRRWDNLMQRHDESRKLTDLPVLTADSTQAVKMPDFAPELEIKSGRLSLEQADDPGVSPYYQHAGMLHFHRDYAQNLNSDLVSALSYSGDSVQLYLLIQCQNEYHILLYNPNTKTVRSPSFDENLAPENLLDLIQCNPETEVAMVEASEIETLSDTCLKRWCKQHNIDESNIIRECTLYLKPQNESDSLKELLAPLRNSKEN